MYVRLRFTNDDGRRVLELRTTRPDGTRGHLVELHDGEQVSRGTGYGFAAARREARRLGYAEAPRGAA